jgi:hypothetical protein
VPSAIISINISFTFFPFEKKSPGSDQIIAVDIVRLGNDSGAPAQGRLDKENGRTVTQPFKKTVVHPFAKTNPPKIIIDSDNGNHRSVNFKMCKE